MASTGEYGAKEKILLALLPSWTPLIPPQGIARLKGFLQGHGYTVKTVDANLEGKFRRLYDKYFETLKTFIPEERHGNFYNIGNDVWREHMMAHQNRDEVGEGRYIELVKILVDRIFYWPVTDEQVGQLNGILDEFYAKLEAYVMTLLERENPDVLGLSVYRDTLASSLFAFKLARRHNPRIRNVMGGGVFTIQLPVGSPNMEYFLEKTRPWIDKIIVGEGEHLLLKYLRGELPESKRLFTPKDRGPDETVGFGTVDLFDFSDFNLRNYYYHGAAASRSCPNRCSFCNVAVVYGEHKMRPPGETVRHMTELYKRTGSQLFFMLDALMNPVASDLANAFIENDTALYWDGYLRVDGNVDEGTARLWRRGGYYRARLGVESGSQRVLDLMNKNITVDDIRSTIRSLAAAGIKTTAYIVIGHPGETESDFQQTLDLIEELKDDLWEVENNPFTYFFSGQGKTDDWASRRRLLYPEWATEALLARTWFVEGVPTRQEMYDRVYRLVNHCRKLGVSTPWSLWDITKQDERWQKLHPRSVPPVLDLIKKDHYIDECRRVG